MMKWGTVCNAAPWRRPGLDETQTYRASITTPLCRALVTIASYSSSLRQLSLATTGTAFHPLYNWITKTPSFSLPLLPSHVFEQGLVLFMSQNSSSSLTSSFFKSFLIWRPFSFLAFLLWLRAFYTALNLRLLIITKLYTHFLRAYKFPQILTSEEPQHRMRTYYCHWLKDELWFHAIFLGRFVNFPLYAQSYTKIWHWYALHLSYIGELLALMLTCWLYK